MRSLHVIMLGAVLLAGCDDDPLVSKTPGEPAPPAQGIQAFIQVDNDRAVPGQEVRVWVRVQLGGETSARLGSYTGRLRFAPGSLRFVTETPVDDGMRVTNAAGADAGDLRFAGAAPTGFTQLTLYQATFTVEKEDYLAGLRLEMEEVSAAVSLTNLTPGLRVAPQVFLRAGN